MECTTQQQSRVCRTRAQKCSLCAQMPRLASAPLLWTQQLADTEGRLRSSGRTQADSLHNHNGRCALCAKMPGAHLLQVQRRRQRCWRTGWAASRLACPPAVPSPPEPACQVARSAADQEVQNRGLAAPVPVGEAPAGLQGRAVPCLVAEPCRGAAPCLVAGPSRRGPWGRTAAAAAGAERRRQAALALACLALALVSAAESPAGVRWSDLGQLRMYGSKCCECELTPPIIGPGLGAGMPPGPGIMPCCMP